jgi:hypothetical protein
MSSRFFLEPRKKAPFDTSFPRVISLGHLFSGGPLIPSSLFLVPYSLFLVPCSLFLVPCSLFLVPCSLFLVPCSLFFIPYSLPTTGVSLQRVHMIAQERVILSTSLFLIPYSLFPIPCSLFLFFYSLFLTHHWCVIAAGPHDCAGACDLETARGGASAPNRRGPRLPPLREPTDAHSARLAGLLAAGTAGTPSWA